jgi:hypothetical protein
MQQVTLCDDQAQKRLNAQNVPEDESYSRFSFGLATLTTSGRPSTSF